MRGWLAGVGDRGRRGGNAGGRQGPVERAQERQRILQEQLAREVVPQLSSLKNLDSEHSNGQPSAAV
jgi:hypothetical protein